VFAQRLNRHFAISLPPFTFSFWFCLLDYIYLFNISLAFGLYNQLAAIFQQWVGYVYELLLYYYEQSYTRISVLANHVAINC